MRHMYFAELDDIKIPPDEGLGDLAESNSFKDLSADPDPIFIPTLS